MYNTYSIESFINYINDEDDIATGGLINNIKSIFKRFYNWLTKTVPMMIKSFLDKHPKLRNLPVVKKLYTKLKNYEKTLKQMERDGKLDKDANSVLKQLNKMKDEIEDDLDLIWDDDDDDMVRLSNEEIKANKEKYISFLLEVYGPMLKNIKISCSTYHFIGLLDDLEDGWKDCGINILKDTEGRIFASFFTKN